MELKEFVKVTLEQIVEGAAAAQESISGNGGIVNPTGMDFIKDGSRSVYRHAMPQEVVLMSALLQLTNPDQPKALVCF